MHMWLKPKNYKRRSDISLIRDPEIENRGNYIHSRLNHGPENMYSPYTSKPS